MATTLARSTPGSRFDAGRPRRAATPARVTRPEQLRVALFSGNYNYVRDGANQALNQLVGAPAVARASRCASIRRRSAGPHSRRPATWSACRAWRCRASAANIASRSGSAAATRADLAAFAPNIVHLSAPDPLGHRAISWARRARDRRPSRRCTRGSRPIRNITGSASSSKPLIAHANALLQPRRRGGGAGQADRASCCATGG